MKIVIVTAAVLFMIVFGNAPAHAQSTQTGCYDASSRRYLCRVTAQDTYNTQRQSAYRSGRAGRSGERR